MTADSVSTKLLLAEDAVEFARTWQPASATTEFVTVEWLTAAWAHLPDLGGPALAVAEDDSGWCALALAERHDADGRRFVLAGAPLGDEHDVVLSGNASHARLVPSLVTMLERLADEGASVRLDALTAHGRLTRELSARSALWHLRQEPAPVIVGDRICVNETGHDRRTRRLSRLGTVSVRVIDGLRLTEAEAEDFVYRRLASWSCRGRLGELPRVERLPHFPRFMGVATSGLAARGMARLLVIELDGRRVAESLHLGPVADPLMYMISYDPDFAKYSPGRLLLEHSLLALRASPTCRLRTGRGDEQYKLAAGAVTEHVLTARSHDGGR